MCVSEFLGWFLVFGVKRAMCESKTCDGHVDQTPVTDTGSYGALRSPDTVKTVESGWVGERASE